MTCAASIQERTGWGFTRPCGRPAKGRRVAWMTKPNGEMIDVCGIHLRQKLAVIKWEKRR